MAQPSPRRPFARRSSSHRPWWRGKLVQVAGIVVLMYVAYRAWALEYPWPNDLVWNNLSVRLDDFQVWLLTERGEADQSLVFTVFEGFSSGIDHLVEWFNRLLLWLTWAGTTVAGVALVLRFGGVRAAVITLLAFATFALPGLWEESMQTLALMLVAVALSLLVGIPLGIVAGPLRPLPPRDHAVPRRDADRAALRLPDAGRDPVLDRPGRRGRLDDDLRDPAGDPHHGARDPVGAREHGRGGDVDGGDAAAAAAARCSCRSPGG